MTAERLALACTNGFALHLQNVGDVTITDGRFRAPDGRCTAHSRDILHVNEVTGSIAITGCAFGDSQDDGINLHGTYLRVRQRHNHNTLAMRPIHQDCEHVDEPGHAMHVPVGTTISCLDDSITPAFTSTVTASHIEHDGDCSWNVITFADPIPDWVQDGTWVEPVGLLPRATTISNCTFDNITSRGIKLSVHDAVIENCTFTDITSPGLHLTGEFDWEESACPCRVRITSCEFTRCDCYDMHHYFKPAALLIQPKDIWSNAAVCRDITIEHCRFHDCRNDAIQLYHCTDIAMHSCEFQDVAGHAYWYEPHTCDAERIRFI